jgi:Tfp pilus assembly protein PilF
MNSPQLNSRYRSLALAGTLVLNGLAFAADPLAVRYYEDAVHRFNSGDPRSALLQLKNSLQRDPTQLSAKILLGRVYLDIDQPSRQRKRCCRHNSSALTPT